MCPDCVVCVVVLGDWGSESFDHSRMRDFEAFVLHSPQDQLCSRSVICIAGEVTSNRVTFGWKWSKMEQPKVDARQDLSFKSHSERQLCVLL